jgi:hypothetical protein
MKDFLYLVTGVLAGIGGTLVFNQNTQSTGWALIGIAAFILACVLLFELSKKIWIGRADWQIDSTYKDSEPIGKFSGKWQSNDIQRSGFSIYIFMGKVRWGKRKERLINSISFIQGIRHRWNYPLKCEVALWGRDNTTFDWAEKGNEGAIEIQLDKPRRVYCISLKITEPKPVGEPSPITARCWAFEDIKITEVRLPWIPIIGGGSYPCLLLLHLFSPVREFFRQLLLKLRERDIPHE